MGQYPKTGLDIRLPSDEGPNPYDSKTGYQPPEWLTLAWWIGIISMGAGFVAIRHFLGG